MLVIVTVQTKSWPCPAGERTASACWTISSAVKAMPRVGRLPIKSKTAHRSHSFIGHLSHVPEGFHYVQARGSEGRIEGRQQGRQQGQGKRQTQHLWDDPDAGDESSRRARGRCHGNAVDGDELGEPDTDGKPQESADQAQAEP